MLAIVHVFTLRFKDDSGVHQALARIQDSSYLLDCIVDPGRRVLRFRAVPPHDEKLVEAIYALGGLVWCERGRLRPIQGLAPSRSRYVTELDSVRSRPV